MQFDSMTEQLSAMFHELLSKVTGQEQDWHKVMDKLSTEMECKVGTHRTRRLTGAAPRCRHFDGDRMFFPLSSVNCHKLQHQLDIYWCLIQVFKR